MPASITIADAIDKTQIASANAWLILLQIQIIDPTSQALVQTQYFTKNNENIEYQGQLYLASDFTIDFSKDLNTEPSLTVNVFDPTNAIKGVCIDYGGGVGSTVIFTVVNSGNLLAEPELQEVFEVVSTSAPGFYIQFTLGAENPVKAEFPYRRQYRDRCPWPYKGVRCAYSGPIGSCDYTLNGPNGCTAHDNVPRFGGFPGLINRS